MAWGLRLQRSDKPLDPVAPLVDVVFRGGVREPDVRLRAERLARLLAIWDRVPPLDETIALIDAVDVAAVRGFAEGLAQSGKLAMALYGPVDDAPSAAALAERAAA